MKNKSFNIGDTVICLDGIDSHGLLRKGKKYKVTDTDGIRLQIADVPLTWLTIRFKLSKIKLK